MKCLRRSLILFLALFTAIGILFIASGLARENADPNFRIYWPYRDSAPVENPNPIPNEGFRV